jgi:excisionase family DNA binding protein
MTRTAVAAADEPGGEEWLSTAGAASLLGLTSRRLFRLIDTGRLPAYRFGRVVRVRRRDVVGLLGELGDPSSP